ncbi:MAG: LysR family transcriptional regulator [Polaromonas sp.]|nr:LysR family transcriptional regulator [Polaromonas sp.]
MLDQLRQIAIFAKAVDHGSFRGAAAALGLSPSVVSHHVAQLEQRLGTALLHRSTRKLALTPAGERLLGAAHSMLAAAEAGLQDISYRAEQPTGLLRVTAPAGLAQSPLTAQFAAFAQAQPGIQLFIDYTDLRRDLISDAFDVAIRVGRLDDSALKARKLFEVPRRLVATPGFLALHEPPDGPHDLAHWHWVEMTTSPSRKMPFARDGRQETVERGPSRVQVNNLNALVQMALAGIGLAIIPAFLAQPEIAAGRLQHVLPAWQVPSASVYAVWQANAPRDSLVRLFLDHLARTNPAPPPPKDSP